MLDPSRSADDLHARTLLALRDVIDPELGLNVVDLGLVYGVEVDGENVRVRLTMTTPACPLGDHIVREAEERLRALAGVGDVHVELVWEPPWTPDRMSAEAKTMLGWNAP